MIVAISQHLFTHIICIYIYMYILYIHIHIYVRPWARGLANYILSCLSALCVRIPPEATQYVRYRPHPGPTCCALKFSLGRRRFIPPQATPSVRYRPRLGPTCCTFSIGIWMDCGQNIIKTKISDARDHRPSAPSADDESVEGDSDSLGGALISL